MQVNNQQINNIFTSLHICYFFWAFNAIQNYRTTNLHEILLVTKKSHGILLVESYILTPTPGGFEAAADTWALPRRDTPSGATGEVQRRVFAALKLE